MFDDKSNIRQWARPYRRCGTNTHNPAKVWTCRVRRFYPRRAPNPPHPVLLLAEPWSGIPARGCATAHRAEVNWTPIARGLTLHVLRHSHMVMLDEFGAPAVLVEERFSHLNGTVSARHKHVSQDMRNELLDRLTLLWSKTPDESLALSPRSPVAVLGKLLLARAAGAGAFDSGQ
jgi:hypothetical protein